MKNKLKRIAASVLTLALLAVPVLAAAEPVGSRSLNVADGTVYTYSTQAVTSDSGKQTNLHENIFTYKKETQVRPVVAFGSTLYGTSPMNKTIKTLEEQGYSMVAGINGSFFDRHSLRHRRHEQHPALRRLCQRGGLSGRWLRAHRRPDRRRHAGLRRGCAAGAQL